MQLFYIQNTLLININDLLVTRIEKNSNVCFLYNNSDIVGINIFDFPSNFDLKPGLIYPTNNIVEYIEEVTKVKFIKETNFIVGDVVSCDNVPNSHLHKCVVSDGNVNYDVVCGANNVKSKIKVVLAKINTIMPNGVRIIPGKLMGYTSNGMICSSKELKISTSNEQGIMILDNNYKIGDEFIKVYTNLN